MNVVVIVTDSLRRDHLGCYGNDWIKTPNFDALAAESLVFDNAYSEGLPTMPMRTAWWTGRHTLHERSWQPMCESDLLLAEWLWAQNVRTALATDVYHMHKPSFNCGRGFDAVRFIRGQEYDAWITDPGVEVDLTKWHRVDCPATLADPAAGALWKARFEQHLRNIGAFADWWRTDENHFAAQTVRAAESMLDALTESPRGNGFFMWLDLFDPHEPWDAPDDLRSIYDEAYEGIELVDPVPGPIEGYMTAEEVRHVQAMYAAEVTMADRWVGRFLDTLRAKGLLDDTLVIATSDHGEFLGERGIMRKARPWCYEELTHIPLIVRHPKGLAAGERREQVIQPQDLFPTVVDALGVPLPTPETADVSHKLTPPKPLHGESLLPCFDDADKPGREFALSGWHNRSWSLRDGRRAYTRYLKPEISPGWERELYDLAADPGETNNLADARPEAVAELDAKLTETIDRLWREGM